MFAIFQNRENSIIFGISQLIRQLTESGFNRFSICQQSQFFLQFFFLSFFQFGTFELA